MSDYEITQTNKSDFTKALAHFAYALEQIHADRDLTINLVGSYIYMWNEKHPSEKVKGLDITVDILLHIDKKWLTQSYHRNEEVVIVNNLDSQD